MNTDRSSHTYPAVVCPTIFFTSTNRFLGSEGKLIFKKELSNAVVNTIDLSNLNNGFYFVVIRNEMDIVKVVRIVKE